MRHARSHLYAHYHSPPGPQADLECCIAVFGMATDAQHGFSGTAFVDHGCLAWSNRVAASAINLAAYWWMMRILAVTHYNFQTTARTWSHMCRGGAIFLCRVWHRQVRQVGCTQAAGLMSSSRAVCCILRPAQDTSCAADVCRIVRSLDAGTLGNRNGRRSSKDTAGVSAG